MYEKKISSVPKMLTYPLDEKDYLPILQWYTDKCLTTSSLGVGRETLNYSICNFCGAKHSHCGQYLPTNMMSLNSQWQDPEHH